MRVPGFWSDIVRVNGRFQLITQLPDSYQIACYDASGARLWTADTPEGLWYLRAAALPDGTVGAVGQGHKGGPAQVFLRNPDSSSLVVPIPGVLAWGQNCVLIEAISDDAWRVAVQTSPTEWARLTVRSSGVVSLVARQAVPRWPGGDGSTSQGFLQWNLAGEPTWTDANRVQRVDPLTLICPTFNGDAWVGQLQASRGIGFVRHGVSGVIEPELDAFEPRVKVAGDTVAVCARGLDGGAIWAVMDPPYPVTPLALDDAPVPPVPDPPKPEVAIMKLPADVLDEIRSFATRWPVPAADDERRAWTHRVCQQVAYSFPGKGYGHKSAGDGRPHSADVLAQQTEAGLIGWDLIDGTTGTLVPNPDSIDLAGQIFEPVEPVDHLSHEGEPGQVPGTPPDADIVGLLRDLVDDVADMGDAVGALDLNQDEQTLAIRTQLAELAEKVNAEMEKFRRLTFKGEGRILGMKFSMVITPVDEA